MITKDLGYVQKPYDTPQNIAWKRIEFEREYNITTKTNITTYLREHIWHFLRVMSTKEIQQQMSTFVVDFDSRDYGCYMTA